jgi:hypothetical protein
MLRLLRGFLLHGFYILVALLMAAGIAVAQLPQSPTIGDIYDVAGGYPASTGYVQNSGLPASGIHLEGANAVATDAAGNLYFADSDGMHHSLIELVYNGGAIPGLLSAVTSSPKKGYNYVVAGIDGPSTLCKSAFFPCGNGGPAAQANLGYAEGLFVDSKGNVYIADTADNAVRKVDATTGRITLVAGVMAAGT